MDIEMKMTLAGRVGTRLMYLGEKPYFSYCYQLKSLSTSSGVWIWRFLVIFWGARVGAANMIPKLC